LSISSQNDDSCTKSEYNIHRYFQIYYEVINVEEKNRFSIGLILFILVILPLIVRGQASFEELNADHASLIEQVGWIRQPSRWQMLGLSWSPDGTHLAMSTNTGVATTDFIDNMMQEGQHYGNIFLTCVDYSPDNLLIAACNSLDGTIFIWNAVNGEQVATINTGNSAAQSVQFSPDGTLLAVQQSFSTNEEVTLWGIWANGQRQVFTATNAYRVQRLANFVHGTSVIDIGFNADGSQLATLGSTDDVLRIWDTTSEEMISSLQLEDVYSLDFSRDGRYLAISVNESDIVLLDAETYEEIRTISNDNIAMRITDLAVSPNSSLIAVTGNAGIVQIWSVESGEPVSTLIGHPDIAWRLEFNPTGTILASLGWNDGIRLWGVGDQFTLVEAPTATPIPTITPTPLPVLAVGGTAYVQTTGGDVLNVRNSPSRQGERIAGFSNGTQVSVIDGPQEADGLVWWKVRSEDGIEGWVVEAVDDEQTLIPD